MKQLILLVSTVVILCFSFLSKVQATHVRGADLTYRCLSGNTYEFTLTLYRDCSGATLGTTANITLVSNTCGVNTNITLVQEGAALEVSPICASQISQTTCASPPGALPGVRQHVYKGTASLQACSDWIFGYSLCCRNTSNTLSGQPTFYIESTLNNVVAPCNSSPTFSNTPVPYICVNVPYVYNQGAVDVNGDALTYSMVSALQGSASPAPYAGGYTFTNPMTSVPALTIGSTNGNISVTPTIPQVSTLAVRIEERRNNVLIGSVMRDIQVVVLGACSNNIPTLGPISNVTGGTLLTPTRVRVCRGAQVSFQVQGLDVDAGNSIAMTIPTIPGATLTTAGTNPVTGTFTWTPPASAIGVTVVNFQLRDNACPIYGVNVGVVEIEVIGVNGGPDQVGCSNGSNTPQLSAVGGVSYNWSVLTGTPNSLSCTNCPNPIANPTVTTTYRVTEGSGLCGLSADTVVVNVTQAFGINTSNDQTLCAPDFVSLSAVPQVAGTYTYSWSPNVWMNNNTVSNPIVNPQGNVKYFVDVTSGGCTIRDSVALTLAGWGLAVNPSPCSVLFCEGNAPLTLNANAVGTDCNSYIVSTEKFAPIPTPGVGVTNVTLANDAVSGPIAIGFPFQYYCNNYSQFWLSSNGFITFNNTANTFAGSDNTDDVIPTPGGTDNIIALVWDDLNPAAGGTINYFVTGTAPNRRFVLNFINVPHTGSTATVTAQLVLHETTHYIDLFNVNVQNDGGPAVQGIENAAGNSGVAVPGHNGITWSGQNEGWRFQYYQAGALNISWQSPLGTQVATGPTYTITPTTSATYFVVVTDGNSNCSVTSPGCLVEAAQMTIGPSQVIAVNGTANLSASYSGPLPPPDCSQYTQGTITRAPVTLTSPTPITLANESVSGAIPIGFDFNFYCNNYNQLYVSSNGWLTFTQTTNAFPAPTAIPNAAAPNNIIAFAWDDLDPSIGSTVQYRTVGVAPNRRFVLNVGLIRHAGCVGRSVICQVHLVEGSNFIEIHTNSTGIQNNTCNNGPMTMGIEDLSGLVGTVVPGRNNQAAWTAPNEGRRFQQLPRNANFNWTPAALVSNPTAQNPTTNPLTQSQWFRVTVSNGVCTMIDSVFIQVGPLSAEGLSFSGKAEGRQALLEWQTLAEREMDYYAIERSLDGINYEELNQLKANNHQAPSYYSYTDAKPARGVNYYRLRVVDLNGNIYLSNPVELSFLSGGSERMSVYPNPGNGKFNFEFELEAPAQALLSIYDMNGRQVAAPLSRQLPAGNSVETLDLSELGAGVYLYRLSLNGSISTGKLTINP